MKRMLVTFFILVFIGGGSIYAANELTDDEVRQQIIQESLVKYPGNCACPYNVARNGSTCGARSAWSKSGGHKPICFVKEITDQMIQDWREKHEKLSP